MKKGRGKGCWEVGAGSIKRPREVGTFFFSFTGEEDLRFYAVNKKNFSRGERRSVLRWGKGPASQPFFSALASQAPHFDRLTRLDIF